MKQYAVTGMACAACSARVEKAVSRVEGVSSCSVNLLTNSMGVEGDVPDSVIIQAVVDAGYGAHVMEQKKNGETETEDTLKDTETKKLRKRLIASLILLVFLMYLSMGHMMWGWPLPGVLGVNHVAMGLAQMLLTIAIMVINQRFFVSGYKSLWRRSPNMDTLVALGASAAFGYSVYALFAMAEAQRLMDEAKVVAYMHEFYFESAAMILTLITVGKMLEARCDKRLDEVSTPDGGCCSGWKGNFRAGKRGSKGRDFPCQTGGKYPRGWRDFRRKQCSQ